MNRRRPRGRQRRGPVEWLALLDEIANEADRIAMDWFRKPNLRVDRKSDTSPVSQADRAIERMARAAVQRRAPGCGVFGEEEGASGARSTRLIIDPIDSTRNFVRGIPIFATLLAVEVDGEVVAGTITAPALDLRWRAARGAGAYLGRDRICVSSVAQLQAAQIFHGDLGAAAETPPPPGFIGLLAEVDRARGFGDFYQHTLVAQGAGEIAVDPVVAPWDVAAILLLVEEAGGRATSLSGERTIYAGSLVTSNGLLHDEALRLIRSE